MKKYATSLFAVLAAIMILFAGCTAPSGESGTASADTTQSTVQAQRQSDGGVTLSNDSTKSFDYSTVPKFDDKPYVEINGNVPYFTKSELTTKSYESYGELDKYGRCTMCIASVGTDLMPTEERGAIVKRHIRQPKHHWHIYRKHKHKKISQDDLLVCTKHEGEKQENLHRQQRKFDK